MWIFFSQLSKRDFVRSTLAAVVLLQLKFSRPFTNVISFMAFYGIPPRVFHFLSNVNIQAKSHFAIFQVGFCCFFVVLVLANFFALNMEQFEEQISVQYCCSICILFAPS